jgi:hypothetical protein
LPIGPNRTKFNIINVLKEIFFFSVFPGKKSQTLEEIVADVRLRDSGGGDSGGNNSGGGSSGGDVEKDQAVVFPYSRIVFIDSTWNQCRGIHIDQRIAGQCFFSFSCWYFWRSFLEKNCGMVCTWCHCIRQ